MARQNAFSVKVDLAEIEQLSDRLAGLTPERIAEMMVDAVNETVDSAYELSRKAILSGINLTDDYVQSRMGIVKATTNRPEATITAFGGKGFTTSLSHYGAMQETKPVNWSTERILAAGHKLSAKWPGWVARTGDAQRNIDEGDKAAGLEVTVTRSSPKPIAHGFSMPGKVDSEGNLLVFTRDRFGRIRSRSGPSVYQLFRVAAAQIENEVYGDLEQAVLSVAQTKFEKEFQ